MMAFCGGFCGRISLIKRLTGCRRVKVFGSEQKYKDDRRLETRYVNVNPVSLSHFCTAAYNRVSTEKQQQQVNNNNNNISYSSSAATLSLKLQALCFIKE